MLIPYNNASKNIIETQLFCYNFYMKNLIIFDMDGTLLYTLGDLQVSVNNALLKFGYEQKTIDEIRSFVGNGVVKLIERALPAGMDNPDFNGVFSTFLSEYEKNSEKTTRPYEGVITMLEELKKKGFSLAVNSNKYDAAVQALRKKFFPQIDIAIGAREGFDVKPSPQGVLDIVKAFGVKFDSIYFVGDSDVDIMTAKNARVISVGVSWGYRSKESLVVAGADFIIDEPSELLAILNN